MAFGFDLTILGVGIRGAARFRDFARTTVPTPSLTPQEREDLEAFVRQGWDFDSDPAAPWRRDAPEDGSFGAEAGVIARRPDGGLVIVQDRLVVAFQRKVDPKSLLARYEPWEELPFGENLYTVSLPPPEGDLREWIEEGMKTLKRDGGDAVRWTEPVFTFHLQAPPPGPRARTFGLKSLFLTAAAALNPNYDSPMQWQWPLIKLSEAWAAGSTRGTGTTVAVIDDGFFSTTQLPGSNTIVSLNVDGSINTSQPLPGRQHGTFCASLVGSPVDRSLGNGVAPECKLVYVAVSDVMNSPGFAKALALCRDRGADVITCSLGPNGGTWIKLKTLQDAIDDVHQKGRGGKGTVVVWAVTNSNRRIQSTDLESHGPLLCVGPGDKNDVRGASGHGTGLDLIAPGLGMPGLHSINGRIFSIFDPGGGSSFAAPIVAGVAALVIAVNSDLKSNQVVDIIEQNCDKRPANPPTDDLGFGRVSALKAVNAALASRPRRP